VLMEKCLPLVHVFDGDAFPNVTVGIYFPFRPQKVPSRFEPAPSDFDCLISAQYQVKPLFL
jgi:hypothetical protein